MTISGSAEMIDGINQVGVEMNNNLSTISQSLIQATHEAFIMYQLLTFSIMQ
jgi:hypothetical protein